MTFPRILRAGLVAVAAYAIAGFAQTVPPAPMQAPGQSATQAKYLLNLGDVIEFKFSYNPDLNERVTVRPDGFVTLPMIGDIEAAGRMPEDLAKAVSARFDGVLRHPDVVVIVREFSAQRVFVAGEVNTPGVLPLVGRLTMAQAVLNAGGPKPTARLSQVLLLRYEGENRSTVQTIRLTDILKGVIPDVPLSAYDVVFIPRTAIAKVGLFVEQYVNNLVPRSLFFPYNINNNVSVRQ